MQLGVPEAHIPMAMDAGSHVECEYHADTDDWVVHVQGLRESEYKVKVGVESPPTVTPDGRTVTVMTSPLNSMIQLAILRLLITLFVSLLFLLPPS